MTSSNYGTTGQSWVPDAASFDLNADPDEVDDYDYLPIPEGEDDSASQDRPAHRSVPGRIPFSHLHQPPVPFDDRDRDCFMPGTDISVEITAVVQNDRSKILNPNLYTIHVSHGEYKWTVTRRYKHFRSLHDSLYLFKLQTTIPMPTKEARERRKYFAKTKVTTKFPKRPETFIRSDRLEERKQQLQGYLQSVLKCPLYKNHPEMLKFLEVSHLSFINGLGEKYKEGMVEKRAGGRRIALHCFSCCACCQPGHWQERYLILKDTFVAYLRPSDGTISDVLLMDRDFSVKYGLRSTGMSHGLLISNLSRHLLVKCWTQRKAHEWHEDIQRAIKEKGQDYTQPNRFHSFVPERKNSYVNWFVDGATYMAAVADALETAKEEIFITDWMLSPELHLKRPVMDGDRWRLDVILQRKASQGVKVFILVYKEMEMALGINSFYTKHALTSKHENIKVMRHPDGIKLWSHHEKCVVIDQRLAFLGGIDLCYGRWDTRKHRLTDLGKPLNNIFGVQDSAALDSLLHNVPKKDSLLSPEGVSASFPLPSQPSGAKRPSNLECIQEISPKQVDIQTSSGGSDTNRVSDSKSGKRSSRTSQNDGVAVSSDGYCNPCLVDDSPSPQKNHTSRLSNGEKESTTRSKYSVFGADIASSSESGSRLMEQESSPGKRTVSFSPSAETAHSTHLVHQTESIDNDSASDDARTPKREGNGVLSSTVSEISLSQVTNTLQTFLKNLSEKNAELAEVLRSEGNKNSSSSLEALDLQRQKQVNGVEVGVRSSPVHKREAFLRLVGRRQTYDVADVVGTATTAEHPKDLGVGNKMAKDGLTEKELAKVLGPAVGEKTEAKPVTPLAKRKLKWKTVVDTKIMFQKQLSVDVGSDDTNRPWDERVFHEKEKDIIDGAIDARVSRQKISESSQIWVGKDYVNFIFKDFVELDNPFLDMVDRAVTPRMPWHDIAVAVFGKPARDVARHFIQRWNFTKLQKRKTNVGIPMLLPKSSTIVPVPKRAINSAFCCSTQILRSACDWSAGIKHIENSIHEAYIELIRNAEHYIYIENQFFITIAKDKIVENELADALFEKIVEAHRSGKMFRVYVIMPLLPAFEGQLGTSTGTSIQAVMHWNYNSISRGGNSLLERLVRAGVHDPFEYISFYGLRKLDKMGENLMTELIYVHSKLMIVDDLSVIIGSANINDRSLLGSRDSELAVLVEDFIKVDSLMNGQHHRAGAFACSLRKSLFREHLGIEMSDSTNVSDPVCAEFYKNVWLKHASINTTIYEKVFGCIPTDAVLTISQLHEFENRPKLVKTDPDAAKALLERVKGHLVLLPLQFLANETLTPAAGTKEALAPTVIWT